MIQEFMGGARAAQKGDVALHQAVSEPDHRRFPFFTFHSQGVLQKPLEAGDHLVGLGIGILVGGQPVCIGQLKDISAPPGAGFHQISGKI